MRTCLHGATNALVGVHWIGVLFFLEATAFSLKKLRRKKRRYQQRGFESRDQRDHAVAIIHNGIWRLAMLLGMERIRTYDFGSCLKQ